MMRALSFMVILLAPSWAMADHADALAELAGPTGPKRFAVVREGLYRGGQPTPRHVELLHAAGVETIVDLRLPDGDSRKEAAAAARLGMRFINLPFTGLLRVDPPFLMRVVDVVRGGGRVYVHCNVGRDRTSLIVALYRVLVDGWDPATAWQREAVAFGYRRGLFHGSIVDSFDAATRSRQ
jgi:protein tyrosine/serine phosphatase